MARVLAEFWAVEVKVHNSTKPRIKRTTFVILSPKELIEKLAIHVSLIIDLSTKNIHMSKPMYSRAYEISRCQQQAC